MYSESDSLRMGKYEMRVSETRVRKGSVVDVEGLARLATGFVEAEVESDGGFECDTNEFALFESPSTESSSFAFPRRYDSLPTLTLFTRNCKPAVITDIWIVDLGIEVFEPVRSAGQ